MLELLSVDFSFQHDQEKRVLSEVSLSVAPNQIVSVVGKSGCGKSTLFKLCTTELTPTRGAIRFQGRRDSVRGCGLYAPTRFITSLADGLGECDVADEAR